MSRSQAVSKQLPLPVIMLSLVVSLHGMFVLGNTLAAQVTAHHGSYLSGIVIDVPVLFGVSLIYLSMLLRRQKWTAWLVALAAYTGYAVFTFIDYLTDTHGHNLLHEPFRTIVLPLLIALLLVRYRSLFFVRSDLAGFRTAIRFSLLLLFVVFVYGVVGFTVMDTHDFHQEIAFPSAAHYTLDQFDLTTDKPLHPYTRRARVFVDSLTVISTAAVAYAVLALFQPIRLRLGDQRQGRERMAGLLAADGLSEDFFKLWPHDKNYFFNPTGTAGLAYHVTNGIALCLGDPAGKKSEYTALLESFEEVCFRNDWVPAYVHVQKTNQQLYASHGYSLQSLGQEAVVNIAQFQATVRSNKYFRQISNRFTKQAFTFELLPAPHHAAVIKRLREISNQWLARDGHDERRFVMGYFSNDYVQQCPVAVVRDAAGTIQAFLVHVPAVFDKHEATYDMLRQADSAPSNVNDFLLLGYIAELEQQGFQKVNLGLCPLAGIDQQAEGGLIDSALRLVYANGDRFYSFSGLTRFKAKYEPEWRDRYIAYKGGLVGFTRTMTALMRTMRVRP